MEDNMFSYFATLGRVELGRFLAKVAPTEVCDSDLYMRLLSAMLRHDKRLGYAMKAMQEVVGTLQMETIEVVYEKGGEVKINDKIILDPEDQYGEIRVQVNEKYLKTYEGLLEESVRWEEDTEKLCE
jgi:predicted nucleic acid-binding OB-fold protein